MVDQSRSLARLSVDVGYPKNEKENVGAAIEADGGGEEEAEVQGCGGEGGRRGRGRRWRRRALRLYRRVGCAWLAWRGVSGWCAWLACSYVRTASRRLPWFLALFGQFWPYTYKCHSDSSPRWG